MTVLKWAGTVLGVAGALLLALNLGGVWPLVAYWLFLLSSAIWSVVARQLRDWPLFCINAVFTVINVIGIVRWG